MSQLTNNAQQVTDLEIAVLTEIAFSEFNPTNGARPTCADHVECWLWVNEIAAAVKQPQNVIKGVLGSLVKKQCIKIIDGGSDDAVVNFTDLGFTAFDTTCSRQD